MVVTHGPSASVRGRPRPPRPLARSRLTLRARRTAGAPCRLWCACPAARIATRASGGCGESLPPFSLRRASRRWHRALLGTFVTTSERYAITRRGPRRAAPSATRSAPRCPSRSRQRLLSTPTRCRPRSAPPWIASRPPTHRRHADRRIREHEPAASPARRAVPGRLGRPPVQARLCDGEVPRRDRLVARPPSASTATARRHRRARALAPGVSSGERPDIARSASRPVSSRSASTTAGAAIESRRARRFASRIAGAPRARLRTFDRVGGADERVSRRARTFHLDAPRTSHRRLLQYLAHMAQLRASHRRPRHAPPRIACIAGE